LTTENNGSVPRSLYIPAKEAGEKLVKERILSVKLCLERRGARQANKLKGKVGLGGKK